MKKVTVIGSGFAGLTAIRQLRKLDASLDITLISPRPELQFYPSLIWVPSGLRTREDIVVPLDNFLRRMRVNYHRASATGLRDGGRIVETDNGEVANDGVAALHRDIAYPRKPNPHWLIDGFTMPQAGEAIRAYPDTPVLIDHLAEPHMGTAVEYAQVLALAQSDNVYMKLSGLNHFSQDAPLYLEAQSFTRLVIDAFGPDRLVWGSGTPEISHSDGKMSTNSTRASVFRPADF